MQPRFYYLYGWAELPFDFLSQLNRILFIYLKAHFRDIQNIALDITETQQALCSAWPYSVIYIHFYKNNALAQAM